LRPVWIIDTGVVSVTLALFMYENVVSIGVKRDGMQS